MLNSKQIIETTGISRATLNNYVALGILPNPIVKTSPDDAGRATRLGYFEDQAVATIQKVKDLKKQGHSMTAIAAMLKATSPAPESPQIATQEVAIELLEPKAENKAVLPRLSLDNTIDGLPGAAYMVNNNFELIWWNDAATDTFFGGTTEMPGELESRNLLKLLFDTQIVGSHDELLDLLKPHIAAGKKRLNQQALIKIYSALESEQLNTLKSVYESVDAIGKEPMIHYPCILPSKGSDGEFCDLYVCFYREGILFTYNPVQLEDDFLLEFLSKRNFVINELLKNRKPYLTNVAVMVADVQNSTRICSELPAEEYFELINDIWQQSEPIYRKYYGTYGKHVGDGMVYYFFPQPDCDYKLNAIQCSLELKEMMKGITRKWQERKGWFSDVYLNIGVNEGQEWFGSYHAGGHVEFTVLGQTINHAARISDYARNGSVWATKAMLNQIPAPDRKKVSFGITRTTPNNESVFVTDTYASIENLMPESELKNSKFKEIEMLPLSEIRGITTTD
ncbi:MAG: adenylate/guanylate cyclase domain-containing protein [Pseudohongiellaceae bacterium]